MGQDYMVQTGASPKRERFPEQSKSVDFTTIFTAVSVQGTSRLFSGNQTFAEYVYP